MNEMPLDPAVGAELRRLVAQVLAEVLPGLLPGQPSPRMDVPSIPENTDGWHIHPAPTGRQQARAPATVLAAGGVPSGVPAGRPATSPPASPNGASRTAGASGITRPASPNGASRTGGTGARPESAPAGSGTGTWSGTAEDFWAVRIVTDAELRDFVLRVLRLADNPRLRRDLIAGRIRFRLAEQPPGVASQAAHRVEKGAVTERAVAAAAKAGARLVLGPRAVLTPLARDKARALGVPIDKER
ncbi:MAG TPA: hypothetical protein VMU94_24265 [Streptosporangiaceae bacterium]|nr:hypothetical protein [Streptosporangiaceae bacterium]